MSNVLYGHSPLTWRSPLPNQLSILPRPTNNQTYFLSTHRHLAFRSTLTGKFRREVASPPHVSSIFTDTSVFTDLCATAVSGAIAQSVLRLWEETAQRGIFDQGFLKTLSLFVTTSKLCWKLEPTLIWRFVIIWIRGMKRGKLPRISGPRGAVLAALIPCVNIIKMLVIGLEIWKDEGTVKSISRYGDPRELLKGPLYYVSTIALAAVIFWRTSPISIAIICNLCAGDGIADIIGRRFGTQKLPYNSNKSFVGSISMAIAGFIASIGFMQYFSIFGYIDCSWKMVIGFLIVSIASALVESHPLSTEIDDNLTVPLTGVLIGTLVF